MENIQVSFNKNKALSAILYVAKNLKRKDFHKIFKVLYFADRDHFSIYARPITGDTYIAMNDGPVPSKIYDIFKSVRGDSYFSGSEEFSGYFKIVDWDIVEPLTEPNFKFLSKTDLVFLSNSLEKYKEMTWEEIKDISHDYAWNKTALNKPMSYDDIVLETGENDSYISYVKEQSAVYNLLK